MSTPYDACIIGGGIIGLSVAFELARRGERVCVLERATIGEDAAAAVAAGMLAPVSEADISHPELTRLSLASAEAYPEWVTAVEAASGMHVGYETTGTLIVALHRDHLAAIEHLRGFQRDRGLDTESLTRTELRDLEPALSPNVVGGIYAHGDRQVDPRRLLHALAAGVRALVGEVREHIDVHAALPDSTHAASSASPTFAVRGSLAGVPQEVHARRVVLAAGAWSGEVQIGGPDLPLRPVKGQVLRLRGERLLRHVLRTPDVYIVPRADGELVIGATMEDRGFDRQQRAGAVLDLLVEASRVLPGVRELDLAECNVGFRPALRDHLPAIGAVAPGVFVATGHFRDGVLLSPITALLLADVITGARPAPLLDAFAPSRLSRAEALT